MATADGSTYQGERQIAELYRPRDISDEEFVRAFENLIRRLDSHIGSLDRGDLTFRNDLAAVVRILLGRDKANQAIRRLCSRFGFHEPRVSISSPAATGDDVLLSIGGLPILSERSGDEPSPSKRTVRISSDLLETVPLFVRLESGSRQFTWQAIIDDYGNSFGAHLSVTIPRILDLVQFVGVGSTDFGTFMLRTIGVAASHASHRLLTDLRKAHQSITHDPYFLGSEITGILYLRRDGKEDVRAEIRRKNWKEPGIVCTVATPNGKQIVFSVTEGGEIAIRVAEIPEGA